MAGEMRQSPLLHICAVHLMFCAALAQQSTVPAVTATDELPGLPKNPPIFSSLIAIWQGALQFEDNINVKGPVLKIIREESQTSDSNPDPFRRISVFNFDPQGHLIYRDDESPMGRATTTLEWVNGRIKSTSTVRHGKNDKTPDAEEWGKWSYDDHGRLSEFRAGRDKEQTRWFVNFRYDAKGRLLGYEDKAVTLFEISYSGNTITVSNLEKYNRHKFFEQVQRVDATGRVTDLKVFDINAGRLKLWYHVAFKYDQQGRIVQQDTDPFKMGDGDDNAPLPGKLLVSYDDVKRTGEQKFFDPAGKLSLHTRFEFDRDGVPIKFHILDPSERERIGSEIFVDSMRHSTVRAGNVEWEVLYDEHGNWTERRRWFTPADGSPRIMTRIWKQAITYR